MSKVATKFRAPWSEVPREYWVSAGNNGCPDLKGKRGTIPIKGTILAWDSDWSRTEMRPDEDNHDGLGLYGVRVWCPPDGHSWPRDISGDPAWMPIEGSTTQERLCWLFYYFQVLTAGCLLNPRGVHREFSKIEEYCGPVGEHFNP